MTSTEASRGFRAWQFFVVLGLVGATIAVWREPRFTRPEHLILLSLAMVLAAVAAGAFYRTLLPLYSPERIVGDSRRAARQREALEREKRLVLRSIKELEFDRAMGKVADADFEEMVTRLRQRAVGLMQRIEAADAGLQARIAKDLAETPAVVRATTSSACPSCQTINDADARFCKACGSAL